MPETAENEERGDIAMSLREMGYPHAADDAGGETIENARILYHEVTGAEWNWQKWLGTINW